YPHIGLLYFIVLYEGSISEHQNLLKAFILATFLHSHAAGIVSRCDFTYLSKSRMEPCHTKGEGGTEMLLSASPKREIVKRGRSNEPSKRLESKSTVAFSSCRENSRVGLLLFGYSYTMYCIEYYPCGGAV
ncbi:hypothetical protein, partial [[Ruminococcus] lactaris]|uniref:hypothetical protein n=1 Tax=[Ruminococcus] lactaris TaxID=46228 RepID=UPI001D05A7EC